MSPFPTSAILFVVVAAFGKTQRVHSLSGARRQRTILRRCRFHAEHLLFLIDEASGIDDIVFEVGMGALSTPGAKVVMAGNPTRTSGFFYDTHHSLRHRWHTMHVSCLDVPRAQGHIEDIKAKYGDASNAYRVRVLGEFPTSDDETVIPLELVLGAVGRDVSTLDYYPVWAWTSLASETTARRLPSDRRTSSWSQ